MIMYVTTHILTKFLSEYVHRNIKFTIGNTNL